MTYDAANSMIVMFGGRDRSDKSLGDTWGFDSNGWRKLDSTGPIPRSWHTMTYDAARKVVVLFGGRNAAEKPLGDTWEWNGTEWNLVDK